MEKEIIYLRKLQHYNNFFLDKSYIDLKKENELLFGRIENTLS